ncbi:Tetratricopeptide repeat protein [Paragonimus westermani]|uniref:Regulator of microtubule dynamics protein 1 n=1 Tax=Paragonimus westermani TaxID=34504 RepID=A0A8T0DUQ3_9TREM|nr:Tetratricopeptide repeat protein [Paragonimus westermani]
MVSVFSLAFTSVTIAMEDVISEFTALQEAKKYEPAYNLIRDAIKNRGMNDSELHWRHSLICRDMAMTAGKQDSTLYKRLVEEGLEAAEAGLKINPEHPKCHCWSAIHLNYLSQLEGINKRIENSFKMKEHWLKAIKANPDDAITLHALGRWCFEVTDLPWIKRKFAQAFFSTPPTSTYEEVDVSNSSLSKRTLIPLYFQGLEYLLASEKVSPNFIANNSLYLAKTYQRLKNKDLAKHYCQQVLDFKDTDLETEEAKKEASEILKNL